MLNRESLQFTWSSFQIQSTRRGINLMFIWQATYWCTSLAGLSHGGWRPCQELSYQSCQSFFWLSYLRAHHGYSAGGGERKLPRVWQGAFDCGWNSWVPIFPILPLISNATSAWLLSQGRRDDPVLSLAQWLQWWPSLSPQLLWNASAVRKNLENTEEKDKIKRRNERRKTRNEWMF